MKVLSHARYFASNFFICSAHKTLGELNSKHAWQFLTTSILPVLKIDYKIKIHKLIA